MTAIKDQVSKVRRYSLRTVIELQIFVLFCFGFFERERETEREREKTQDGGNGQRENLKQALRLVWT